MDVDAARTALDPQTLALLASLPPYDHKQALRLAQSLRAAGAEPTAVTAALTQSRLRHAARAKLGEFASGMLFTQAGLEQATRLNVAARHAKRFADARIGSVADLTCGLGIDAMAFASLDIDVTAFEIDRATALLADYNLRHWDNARVVWADAMVTLAQGDIAAEGIFADPARRDGAGRKHNPKDYSPALDDVVALQRRYPALGLKVGPGIPHEAIPPECEAQWISVDGDVVECGLWLGPLARHHGHSALVIAADKAYELTGTTERADVGPLGRYLYEPDGAVIRAGLIGVLAAAQGAHLIDSSIAYLSADHLIETPFATAFEVSEVLPYSEKTLAAALKARGIGTLEIKKRGMDIDPAMLRKRLKLRGDASATVFLTRVNDDRLAILAKRQAQG